MFIADLTAGAPDVLARLFSTLDDFTEGRMIIDVVTSCLESAVRNIWPETLDEAQREAPKGRGVHSLKLNPTCYVSQVKFCRTGQREFHRLPFLQAMENFTKGRYGHDRRGYRDICRSNQDR